MRVTWKLGDGRWLETRRLQYTWYLVLRSQSECVNSDLQNINHHVVTTAAWWQTALFYALAPLIQGYLVLRRRYRPDVRAGLGYSRESAVVSFIFVISRW